MKCPECRFDTPTNSRFCPECGSALRSEDGTPAGPAPSLRPDPEGSVSHTRTVASALPRPNSLFAGKYRILDEIGRGGMGIVVMAEDTRLGRRVALKFLPPASGIDPEARDRFIREARAAAVLEHHHICTIFDAGEADGALYIAMAFVPGLSLKDRLAAGPLEVTAALEIAGQVAAGLAHAHGRGVVHRDVKPANIMLAEGGGARIMDFGLAKLERGADLTAPRSILGTAAYMSPEQARGDAVDHRSDIWSLGCMLFEMLSGTRPFAGANESLTMQAILTAEPRPLRSAGRAIAVPARLEDVVRTCLEKDPARRFQSAAALAAALSQAQRTLAEAAAAAPRPRAPSIAVLPFADMSPRKDQEYFCDGMAEELINGLAHIHGVRVTARTSAFAFKGRTADVREIGRTLGVDTVLEGSVRQAGSRLRITAQLIRAEDGFHLWSEKFDRDLDDVFAIQDEISAAIVDALKVRLLADEKARIEKRPTADPEAYRLYLRGQHLFSRPSPENFDKALALFDQAVARDPDFALAHAGRGSVFTGYASLSMAPPAEAMPKAKAAFRTALDLDGGLAEAYLHSGYIALYIDWDWDAADGCFRTALALHPGSAFTHAFAAWNAVARRRFDEAVREIDAALELDPLVPLFNAFAIGIRSAVGRFAEAAARYDTAIELDPRNGLAHFHGGMALVGTGDFDGAEAALRKAAELGITDWADHGLALIRLRRGDRTAAEGLLEGMLERRARGHACSTSIAFVLGALGRLDEAFAQLDRAFEERNTLLPFVHLYAPLHAPALAADPRFEAFLDRLGIRER